MMRNQPNEQDAHHTVYVSLAPLEMCNLCQRPHQSQVDKDKTATER